MSDEHKEREFQAGLRSVEATFAREVAADECLLPEAQSQWRHRRTGRLYRVLCVANAAATKSGWPVTVVYDDQDGHIWAKPVGEFTLAFEPRRSDERV